MNTEKIDALLDRARSSIGFAHDAWGESQLDDELTNAVRDLVNVNTALVDAVAELAAAPKRVGPFEAGRTYALILPEAYNRYADATSMVQRELARLHELTGVHFAVFPPGTQFGIATQEE